MEHFFWGHAGQNKKQRNGALRTWDTGHRKSMGNPVYADVSGHQA